jgi:hypothetical protein
MGSIVSAFEWFSFCSDDAGYLLLLNLAPDFFLRDFA